MKRTQKTTKLNKKETKSEGSIKKSLAMKARWAAINSRTKDSVLVEPKNANVVEGLSIRDVHDIIRTCQQCNILSFHFGGLRLLFKKSIEVPKTTQTGLLNPSASVSGASRGRTKNELQGLSDIASDELELLKITDPLGYEQFMQSEDAVDDGHSGT